MDYGVLQPIIESLQFRDNLKIFNLQDIKIKRYNSDKIEIIESPFSTKEQFEDYIASLFGDFKVEFNQIHKHKIDIDNHLEIICVHKAETENGSYLLHFRKLRKDYELIKMWKV